jgi:hypothetical protein
MTTAKLRIRQDNTEMKNVVAPFSQSGPLIDFIEKEGGIVVMSTGHGVMHFFVSDFEKLFNGHENAQMILRDAVHRHDSVQISVRADRLSYHNSAQYARLQG